MKQSGTLKEVERKVFLSFHEDGLIDLFLSFIMVVSIISTTLSAIGAKDAVRISIYVPLMVVIGPLLYMLGKKLITFPRLGYVRFTGKRIKYRLVIFVIVTAVLVTLLLMTIISGSDDANNTVIGIKEEIWSSVFMTAIILGIFFLIATLMGIARFYLLGIIVAVSEPLFVLFERYTTTENVGLYAFGIPALFLLISGVLMLRKFIRKYPLVNTVTLTDNGPS